jgi:hypothetical protein
VKREKKSLANVSTFSFSFVCLFSLPFTWFNVLDAKSKHLQELNYVLYPKVAGLSACLVNAKKINMIIHDITIAYRDFKKDERPSEIGLVLGRFPKEVHLFIRRYRLEELPSTSSEVELKEVTLLSGFSCCLFSLPFSLT